MQRAGSAAQRLWQVVACGEAAGTAALAWLSTLFRDIFVLAERGVGDVFLVAQQTFPPPAP